ncbi:hypothetical protein GMOD_00001890 [Pyrenophora seminiperda CCB06]|uniref:Uncharacterized protein n=1 Tax=Pyrenophora seminiperda CCB06 TaxID=1302712 RepID=A0A3M7LWJ3_9PLEO|nr:hypothetical protein GMOD_00001890 [Pyrenophora seminiperda CCB06]
MPPHPPSIIQRGPLHGIHMINNDNNNNNNSTSKATKPSSQPFALSHHHSSLPSTCTVLCSEPICSNTVIVTPHGTSIMGMRSVENTMYIKVRCKKCEPPVIVFDLWGTPDKEDGDREKGGEWGATEWAEEKEVEDGAW